MPLRLFAIVALWAAGLVLANRAPAAAIPVFAHRYGLSCQSCHTAIPHLNSFGEAFLDRGYRLPMRPRGVVPVAVKVNLQYGGDPQGDARGPLPKAVVDEIELLTGGSVGRRTSYFAETYLVDGGRPGHARDLWVAHRIGGESDEADGGVTVRAGQFTLDLPVDPETFRETTDHYAVWDLNGGDNPFTFFDPHVGAMASLALPHDTYASLAVLKGHDVASGYPDRGLDTHLFASRRVGALVFSAYRTDGSRPVDGGDRFWRNGYGAGWSSHRLHVDAVYQHGRDSSAAGGAAIRSTGGFLQARLEIGARAFAIARYDGTQASQFSRSLIVGGGYRVARNARLTAFDTIHRGDDGARLHSLSTALLFAY